MPLVDSAGKRLSGAAQRKIAIKRKAEKDAIKHGVNPDSMTCESHIEIILLSAMKSVLPDFVEIKTQVEIGKYRVDFLIIYKSINLVVEADGKQFHKNKEHDNQRDIYLTERGYKVIRFTGKRIYSHALACASEVFYEIFDPSKNKNSKIANLLKTRFRASTASDVYDTSIEEPRLPIPLPWGRLNVALGGGLPAENWSLLSAPPKRGKSCFVSACAAFWARHGKRVLIIATEASADEVVCRLLAQETGIGWVGLRRMSAANRRELAKRPEWFSRVAIVEHEPGELVSTIVASHIADTGERPIVLVDHFHDVALRLNERDERRAIDLTSSDIKRTAQREKLVILAIGIQAIATIAGESSRVGARANENTGKGSSKLAYDAAAVLAMSSEPFERGQEETRAEITVAFCREAATVDDNTVSLVMNGATGQFREVDAAATETSGPKLTTLQKNIVSVMRDRETQMGVGVFTMDGVIAAQLSERGQGKALYIISAALADLVAMGSLKKKGKSYSIVSE